jgi:hypothetical protein
MGLLLSPDHTATLTDPQTWNDNPFVARDMRRDIKKRQPFISFCWMCGILFVLAPLTASLTGAAQSTILDSWLVLGGNLGTGICLLVSGIHIWFIIGAAKKHTTTLFTQESNQNTLSSLLMLPASPFQILVQSMAYPWIAAMRMAVALLPIYVLCVGLDGPTWSEVAMLYLVFAIAALSVPFWKRPALSENVSILSVPRSNRLGAGSAQTTVNQGDAAKSVNTSGVLIVRLLLAPFALTWWIFAKTGVLSALLIWLTQDVPKSIVDLVPWAVISWPFMCARLLIAPLDWFGTTLIPLPFVIFLVLLSRYVQLVTASEFLSVGAYRDLPLQSTYRPRLRLAAALRSLQALAITGYLWKPLVVNGGFAFAGPQVAGSDPGLAGFAFALLCFATFWAMIRSAALGQFQRRPLILGERDVLCRNSLLDGVRYLAEPFGFAITFYLVCCFLARTYPFPPLAGAVAGNLGEMFLHVCLIGFSGAVLSFGVTRLLGPFAIVLRVVIPVLIGIGVMYNHPAIGGYFLLAYPQVARALLFLLHLRALEIFSPFVGMLRASASQGSTLQQLMPEAPPWYAWVFTSLGLGCTMWIIGHLLSRRREEVRQDVVTLVFNPTTLGKEVFSDPIQQKQAGISRTDTPFVLGLIQRLQQFWDNAVLTRELRSRLRGQCERPVLLAVLGCAMMVSLVFFLPSIALWPTIMGGGLAWVLMGPMPNALAATAAGILGCWYLVLFVSAFLSAFTTTGAFYTETQKSTLGFLLATPMSTRSIVMGKAFGILGPSFGILLAICGWTFALTVLFLPLVGLLALVGWLYAVLSAITFYLTVNSITYAISAMFPKLSMSGSAWVWLLLFFFGWMPMLWIFGVIAVSFAVAGLHGASIWIAFVLVGWLLIVISYVIAESSIQSMRRRDLTFASSARNN